MKKTFTVLLFIIISMISYAQQIVRVEYFIDTDPGFGSATTISITSDSVLNSISFNADLSSLGEGLHTLFVRSLDANGKWSLTKSQQIYKFPSPLNNNVAPIINKLEYFIDTDPGFENATNIPFTSDSMISAFTFNANVASLSEGLHVLYIRSRYINGNWSLTKAHYMYKFPTPINANILSPITKLEYFLDIDPGFGNAINIPISSDSIISNFTFNANVNSLSEGMHSLFIRSMDANGKWSLTRAQYIYKFPAAINNDILPAITKLECFIDIDPGFGNATNVPITSDSIISNFTFNSDVSSLNEGLHTLFVRSMDANEKWSLTRAQYIYKFPPAINNDILPAITKLEYFIDTDPGFGNATNLPIPSDSIISNFTFNANVSSLSEGMHTLFVRSMDANGKWSLTRAQYIYKFPAAINNDILPTITKLEYFIDIDPGFGNATNVPITSDSIISNFTFNASVSSLSEGMHTLFIRSMDANGKWSLTRAQYIYKFPAAINNDILPAITKLEYFIDLDPGFGNAINIPITSDSIISNFTFNANVSSLNVGMHSLFVRSMDINGHWSLTRAQYIYKFPAPIDNNISPDIVQCEYFIDTDPGFGNASPITITSDSILNAVSFNADVNNLTPGIHTLSVRSKDANENWSLTRNVVIYKFPPPINNNVLPSIVKLEYFIDNDPGFGNAINIPCASDSIISNLVFMIDTTNLSLGAHTLSVRGLDVNGKWSLTKNTRFSRNHIKVFIQGYYIGSNTMAPVLMNEGIGTDLSLTDSITVELHNPTSPYGLKESIRTLLHTDGTVQCSFTTGTGSYYIVIKHRNSIETWSSTPVNIGVNANTYDFTTAASKAYGNKEKLVSSGVFAIYSGDINQDDNIDLLDAQLLENEIEAFSYGYNSADLNGDGNVDLVDLPMEEINISNFIFASHP